MDRVFFASGRAIAVVTATALLALCCAGRCAAAARPLGPSQEAVASEASALALPPAAAAQRRAAAPGGYDDAAARAGKWLPFLGAAAGGMGYRHHLPVPAAFWAHKPMPWAAGFKAGTYGGSGGAFEGSAGEEEELLHERKRERSYEHGDVDGDGDRRARQEELEMWASLLNPKAGKRSAEATAGWMPSQGVGEAAGDEQPARTAEGAGEGTGVGETKPGFYWGNNGK